MDVSIIIVSWNTAALLEGCLRSIYSFPPKGEFDIWVVDNASTDHTVEGIRTLFPAVRTIENDGNVGFARANNQAIDQCGGRYVVLLNPDTIIHPHTFDLLVDFMESHPEVGAVGPRYLNPDGSLQISCAPFPSISREFWRMFYLDRIFAYGIYNMPAWDHHHPRQVNVLQGACLLVRRKAIDEIGMLDPGFFMYNEETDLCYRLYRARWMLYWIPESLITHFGGQSTQQAAAAMFLRLYESKTIFMRKHYGNSLAWLYKLVLFVSSLLRMLGYPILWCLFPQKREIYRLTLQNYVKLIGVLFGF